MSQRKSTKFSILLLQIIFQILGLKHLQMCQSKAIDIAVLIYDEGDIIFKKIEFGLSNIKK